MRDWQRIFRLLGRLNLAPAGNQTYISSEDSDKGKTEVIPDSTGLLSGIRPIIQSKLICVGGGITLAFILVAIFADFLATHSPLAQDVIHAAVGPGKDGYLLGTDEFGRDLFSRIIYGTRVSFQVALLSTALALSCGSFLGLVSGYFGGRLDMILGRVVDVMMSFPSLLLAMLVMAVLGTSLKNVIIAIGITYIPRFYRIVRASTLVVRERGFILAAKAQGRRDGGIIVHHVVPNVLAPILVVASLTIGVAILAEAELSFLGLGTQPPTPSLGSICAGGRAYLDISPGISGFSGLAVMIEVLGCNLLGDGLRDVFDPKLRN